MTNPKLLAKLRAWPWIEWRRYADGLVHLYIDWGARWGALQEYNVATTILAIEENGDLELSLDANGFDPCREWGWLA